MLRLTTETPSNDTVQSVAVPNVALAQARHSLEMKLAGNENWRALKQLEAREAAGEWVDVVESDLLRDRLTLAVSAAPEFMAWQFVDAAIGCLEAGEQAAVAAKTAHFKIEATPSSVIQEDGPRGMTEFSALPAASVPTAELAQRIPTLRTHDDRSLSQPRPMQAPAATIAPPAELAARALVEALATAVTSTATPANEQTDPAATLFSMAASHIDEADVEIIARPPSTTFLTTRLPPLPLTPRTQLPAANRTRVLQSAEPVGGVDSDFHPVAFDEAEVAIIATGMQSGAQSRAERRALGIAPDRERQMRRFLRALAGE